MGDALHRLTGPQGTKSALLKKAVETAVRSSGVGVVVVEAINHRKAIIRIAFVLAAILILFFYMIFDETTLDPTSQTQPGQNPLQITKSGPAQVANNSQINYSITVTYPGSADNIIIIDPLPGGTTYVSSSPKGTFDKQANTITWDAQKLKLPLDNPISITVTFVVKAEKKDFYAINQATTNVIGGTAGNGGGSNGANIPPSTNDCSGMYKAYMSIEPSHKNYGDPNCELVKKDPNGLQIFDKDKIMAQLKQIKPSEAKAWFFCIVPRESAYNANAYLRASTSGNGAYGLVQMNPTGKGNGPLDNGEVYWPKQLSNGINYNDTKIGHTFTYWPTSYDSCIRSYGVKVN